jgi:tetratricopeptide (TPR) repeat protein
VTRFPAACLGVLAALGLQAHATASDGCGPAPYDCAVSRVRGRDFPAAVSILEAELAARPGDLKVLNLLGIALTGAGRIDDANRRFGEALSLQPGFLPAIKNLAVNELTQGKLASAQSRFEHVLAETPADPVAHVHLGEIHHRRKAYAAAVRHYGRSGDKVAEDPRWTLHYADALVKEERRADAVAVLGRLAAADADTLFEGGILLGQAGAHADAARLFERARPGCRDPRAAGYNQVLMLIRAGDPAAAVRAGEAMVTAEPAPGGDLHNLMAQAYLGAGRIQEAYDSLRRATRLEPKVEENYLDLAAICIEHENFDLGLEIVDIGLQQVPGSARLHLQRGVLLAMKSLLDQAEAAFESAARLSPRGSVAQVALAMAWMQNGQIPRAVKLLRGRARVARNDPMVHYILGLALVRSGAEPGDTTWVEARSAFESAVRLKPDHAPARAELGKLLVKAGELPLAIRHLETALAADADNVAAAYALAQAYKRGGQVDKAAEMLARVDRLNAGERRLETDDLKRTVIRIVREGTTAAPAPK